MPDHTATTPMDEDEFEQLGRRAGSELRASAPPPDLDDIRTTARRRPVRRTIAATATIGLLVVLAVVATSGRGDRPERIDTVTVPDSVPAEVPQRLVLEGHTDLVDAFDVSADGRTVATASEDGTARIWDGEHGRQLRSFPLKGLGQIDRLEFSPDGDRLAARSYDGEVAYWHAADGSTASPFPTRWDTPDEATEETSLVSPDGSLRLKLGRYGPIDLVDVEDGSVVRTLSGGGSPRPYVGTFSPDGAMVAVKFTDDVRVWRTTTGDEIATFDLPDYTGTAEHMKFTADGKRLAFTVEDAVIIETLPSSTSGPDTGDAPASRVVISGGGNVVWIDVSEDGRTGASASDEGVISIWDPSTGEVRRTITVDGDQPPDRIALSPDARRVGVHLVEGGEQFWTISTGTTAPSFDVSWDATASDGVYPFVFTSPDGKHQIELGRFGPVTLYDPAKPEVRKTLVGSGQVMPYVAAFSPDSALVAVKFARHVQVWNTSTYESIAVFDIPEYNSTAEHLVFVSDGRRLVFTVEDNVIIETVPVPSASSEPSPASDAEVIVPSATKLGEEMGGRWAETPPRQKGNAVKYAECMEPWMSGEIDRDHATRDAVETVDAQFESDRGELVVVQVAVLSDDQVAWNSMNAIADALSGCGGPIPSYLPAEATYPGADHAFTSKDPSSAMVTIDNVLAIVTAPTEADRDAIVTQIIQQATA